MPRRNRAARQRRRHPRTEQQLPTPTTDQLARRLVEQGKASPLILAGFLFRLEPRGNGSEVA